MRQIPESAAAPQAEEPAPLAPTDHLRDEPQLARIYRPELAALARSLEPLSALGREAARALEPVSTIRVQLARSLEPLSALRREAARALEPVSTIRVQLARSLAPAMQVAAWADRALQQGLLRPYQGLMVPFEGLLSTWIPPDLLTSIQRATTRLAEQMAWVTEHLRGWHETPEAIIARATTALESGNDRPLREVLRLLNLPASDATHLAYVLYDEGRYGLRDDGEALWWTAKNPARYLRKAVQQVRASRRRPARFMLGGGAVESIDALGIDLATEAPSEPEWIMGFGRAANEQLERIRADLGPEGWQLYLAREAEGATRSAQTARALGWTEKQLERIWKRMNRVLKRHNISLH